MSASSSCPREWAGKRVILHIGAAESVVVVTLNGREVGIGKDSHLASEFDLREYLRPGSNTLRLLVVKWSDATFIEDQDQWWHGGITRSVFLYATEPVFLADVAVTAGLAGDGRAGDRLAPAPSPSMCRSVACAPRSRMAGSWRLGWREATMCSAGRRPRSSCRTGRPTGRAARSSAATRSMDRRASPMTPIAGRSCSRTCSRSGPGR